MSEAVTPTRLETEYDEKLHIIANEHTRNTAAAVDQCEKLRVAAGYVDAMLPRFSIAQPICLYPHTFTAGGFDWLLQDCVAEVQEWQELGSVADNLTAWVESHYPDPSSPAVDRRGVHGLYQLFLYRGVAGGTLPIDTGDITDIMTAASNIYARSIVRTPNKLHNVIAVASYGAGLDFAHQLGLSYRDPRLGLLDITGNQIADTSGQT